MKGFKKPEAIIWGAGKIGRGFLAEIFRDAGYGITFVDYEQKLVDNLKKAQSYIIHKAMGQGSYDKVRISGFEAYNSTEIEIITDKILKNDTIIAIAVHKDALPSVIKALAPAISEKARNFPESKLDFILCINMYHPADYCLQLLKKSLSKEVHSYIDKNIGLVDSVVMRICPQATGQVLEEDPLAVVTNGYPEMPVDKGAFVGEIPQTPFLRLTDRLLAEEVRKIYTLNMAHAVLAFLGAQKGYEYAVDCVMDKEIHKVVAGALEESGRGLEAEYGFTHEEMVSWNRNIIETLKNPVLGDKVVRLGADSKRKLARKDRLVGPALLCLKYGVTPENLVTGIAYGFRFNQSNDPGTQEVQDYLHENGIEKAVIQYCGLDEEEDRRLIDLIVEAFNKLK